MSPSHQGSGSATQNGRRTRPVIHLVDEWKGLAIRDGAGDSGDSDRDGGGNDKVMLDAGRA